MESLPNTRVLQFNSDTLQYVRDAYGLNDKERLSEAIDILQEWIQKQEHFVVKTFSRDYLERIIINNKGALEKCKKKLDKLCTLRTLSPDYFQSYDFSECDFDIYDAILLPKLTPQHHRVILSKVSGNVFNQKIYHKLFTLFMVLVDLQQGQDYNMGSIILVDFTDASLIDYVLKMSVMELRKAVEIYVEGYSMRLKNIHFLTTSKAVDALLTLMKQVMSPKLASRLCTHTKMDTVYKYIPKEILPVEYGGKEASVQQLRDNLIEELSSEQFVKYRKDMMLCRTDEAHRRVDKYNDEYIGISGTFRNLRVD